MNDKENAGKACTEGANERTSHTAGTLYAIPAKFFAKYVKMYCIKNDDII